MVAIILQEMGSCVEIDVTGRLIVQVVSDQPDHLLRPGGATLWVRHDPHVIVVHAEVSHLLGVVAKLGRHDRCWWCTAAGRGQRVISQIVQLYLDEGGRTRAGQIRLDIGDGERTGHCFGWYDCCIWL